MATNFVANASNSIIKDALRSLAKKQFPKNRIIGPKNVYIKDTVAKTGAATFVTGSVQKGPMSEYIASSIISHCYDGWNFISRSVNTLLDGDISTSIHMAYYSELRAVMLIMATEGVGIFNNKHVYFDSTKSDNVFSKNITSERLTTHKAADQLILEWASINTKKDSVFRSMSVNNRTLTDWIAASGHSATSGYASSVINDWFKSWSCDLRLTADQYMRNEMSYRPHFKIAKVEIREKINEIVQIWQGLEPIDSNRFIDLDKHMLRLTLERLFKQSSGKTLRHSSYAVFINNIFDSLGESKTSSLYDFILRRINVEDHILIKEAEKGIANPGLNFKNPIPMICRSILLLRFATGCLRSILIESGIDLQSLTFWWEENALISGITNTNPSGLDPLDLYADITDSINNLNTYETALTNLKQTNALALPDLCSLKQFQRICFWGIGL